LNSDTQLQQARIINTLPELEPEVKDLQQLQPIDDEAIIHADDETLTASIAPALGVKKPSRLKQLFVLSLSSAIVVEAGLSLYQSFSQSMWLGGLYSVLFASGIALIGGIFWREYSLLRRLKRHHLQRDTAERLLHSEQVGEALDWLTKLNQFSRIEGFTAFKTSLQPHHSDKEVMALYQSTLLVKQDQDAKKIINRFACESGLLVALSPMAIVDMAAVLWRGTKMIEQISQVYGLRLGYASRVSLYRSLLKHMLFAGSAELISDIGTTAIGAELAGKLSARAGQGISAGILTARLGYKAMELSRPIAQLPNKKSLLSDTSRFLLETITKKAALKPE